MDANLFVALVVVLAIAYALLMPPAAVFVVTVRNGQPVAARGTTTEAFRRFAAELCADYGVSTGEIRGVARGSRIALWFSRGLPPGFRQRLRNWWVDNGWPTGPGDGPKRAGGRRQARR